jgi:hypothetical protein
VRKSHFRASSPLQNFVIPSEGPRLLQAAVEGPRQHLNLNQAHVRAINSTVG